MADVIEDLRAEVARNGDVTQSAVALVKGLESRLEAAINKAAEDEDDQPLHDLLEDLRANNEALAKAVTEGTQGGGLNPQSGIAGTAAGGNPVSTDPNQP